MTVLAASQYGVVARWQLRRMGIGHDTVRGRIRDGAWIAATDEVLVRVGSHPGRGQAVAAAVLDAGPGALLSFQSAASWWRVPGAQLEPFHTLTAAGSRRRSTLSTVHVVRDVPPEWVVTLDGIPVARPELLALHLFATEPFGRAERWVERLWSMRLLDGGSIAIFLEGMGRRGRNGTAGLREYLDARPWPYTPSATGVELRARKILLQAGFVVEAQVESGSEERWSGRVDLRDARRPVILEVQSALHHEALVDRDADDRRLGCLREDGFVVVEVTDAEVFHRPEVVVDRYRKAWAEAGECRPTGSVVQNGKEPSRSAQQNG